MYGSRSRKSFLFAAVMLSLFSYSASGYVLIDDEPEITDRVARISFIEGDVQIRRSENVDWEKAALNLPIVEGDIIATGPRARVEIQLNSRNYLRLGEDSLLSLTTLQDAGIAVSLQQGKLLLRVNDISIDREYLEIDAPRSTIAIQRSGEYFIDAALNSDEVLISVFDDGEARIYSETSGFTLRDGRSARLLISGRNAGEWDLSGSSYLADPIFAWARTRDNEIAQRLKRSHYDQYYDRDIYGADELTDYGDWTFDRDYGYIWSPHQRSISYYSNWSPYRYGHWRWLPSFGWTWVNDEPWGWATYHYGRWIWVKGRWYWTPYAYYRYSRSWWRPAIVYITVVNNNVCWYPLSYHQRWYNYNRNYNRRHRQGNPNPGPVATNPTPLPSPVPVDNEGPRGPRRFPNSQDLPDTGVITVSKEDFGKWNVEKRSAQPVLAKTVLSKSPDTVDTPPILPSFEEVRRRPGTTVIAGQKPPVVTEGKVPTGAAPRNTEEPLDKELRRTRIFGNRPPLPQGNTVNTPDIIVPSQGGETRGTGAVARPPIKVEESPRPRAGSPIIVSPPRQDEQKRPPTTKEDRTPPIVSPLPNPEPRRIEQPRPAPPKQEAPPTRSEPQPRRIEPPTRRVETPRYEEPKRSDPPPQRSEPRRQEQPRPAPPPRETPSKPAENKGKGDGKEQ